MTSLPLSYAQVTAVFAADAVARLSGVVGVAAVTAGPGKGIFSFTIVNQMYIIEFLRVSYLTRSSRRFIILRKIAQTFLIVKSWLPNTLTHPCKLKVPLNPKFFLSRQKSPFCSDHIGEKIIVI